MNADQPRGEVKVRNVNTEPEDLQASAQQFATSLVKAGRSLVTLPINLLPQESRSHFQSAGREVTMGVASITRELATVLENVASSGNKNNQTPSGDSKSVLKQH